MKKKIKNIKVVGKKPYREQQLDWLDRNNMKIME